MTRKRKILFFVLLIIIIFFGFKLFRFIQIDNCLDKSGSWDYEKCECDNI
jgi:hypothetical protein